MPSIFLSNNAQLTTLLNNNNRVCTVINIMYLQKCVCKSAVVRLTCFKIVVLHTHHGASIGERMNTPVRGGGGLKFADKYFNMLAGEAKRCFSYLSFFFFYFQEAS